MKFVDYESSHITPQMTLLKKFNEVLKFLKEKDCSWLGFYLHTITINSEKTIYLIDMDNSEITTKKEFYEHFKNSLSCKIDNSISAGSSYSQILRVLYSEQGTPQLFAIYMNPTATTFVNQGINTISDLVSEL